MRGTGDLRSADMTAPAGSERIECSQITTGIQPAERTARIWERSRRRFPTIFRRQNSALRAGAE
ncbi:MAG: hypothetical protein QXG65_02260 [Thermoplasmata archaeon]